MVARLITAGQQEVGLFRRLCCGSYYIKSLRHKRADLALALHQNAQRRRLHTSGTQAVAHLLPNKAREVVAYQAVEHAPRLLRVAQIFVNMARIFERFCDGFFCYFRKRNSFGTCCLWFVTSQTKGLGYVPGDSLALAVGVGRQYYLVGLLR